MTPPAPVETDRPTTPEEPFDPAGIILAYCAAEEAFHRAKYVLDGLRSDLEAVRTRFGNTIAWDRYMRHRLPSTTVSKGRGRNR